MDVHYTFFSTILCFEKIHKVLGEKKMKLFVNSGTLVGTNYYTIHYSKWITALKMKANTIKLVERRQIIVTLD